MRIDEHATNLRDAARIMAAALEEEDRDIRERLRGVSLAEQTARRLLRNTDTLDEKIARIELYTEGLAVGQACYFQRGE